MSYCAKCGSPLPSGAQFCPRCGTPLAAPPVAPVSVAPQPASSSRVAWWIVPVVLLVLGGLAWLVLAGMPFGGREKPRDVPQVETIAEGTAPTSAPRDSGTVVDVTEQPAQATVPEAEADPQPAMLNDEQASATLREFVTSRNYYKVASECVRVESRGFRNRGFDYEVWDSCDSSGASRLLGRWRVDAKTREVFRQYEDGRYLRP